MTAEEQWRPFPGHEGHYEVSDQGRVRSFKRSSTYPQMLKLTPTRDGEVKFNTIMNGIHRSYQAARAVALTWLPAPVGEGIWQVRHRNGDLLDNRPENLYWHKETR